MPVFRYRGYNTDGSPATGMLEADGVQDAALKIKERGIYPKEVAEHRSYKSYRTHKTYSFPLPAITRQLSILLASGVPLVEALSSLAEEHRGAWRLMLVDIKERVSSGASLSRALEEYRTYFPDFYTTMVSAGERSGTLDKVLSTLADFIECQESLKSRVRTALLYPLFMSCVGVVVLSFLFTFVIPKIVRVFETTKQSLPLITKLLIAISNLFVGYWWAITLGMIGLAWAIRQLHRKRKDVVDALKLRLPGSILQSLYYARFSRTLAFLLGGGLSMLAALELSGKSMGNCILEKRIDGAAARLAEGARLSATLTGFPPVLTQLISTGEKSGRLVEVLNKAAASYEDEFNRRVQRAIALLEPSLILAMGVVVGLIVLAVVLPIFQMNQLIK